MSIRENTIEFTDIVLEAPLPLNQYLIENSCLSLRLIVDGVSCGETPVVDGDHETGRWVMNVSFRIPQGSDSFKLAAIVNTDGLKIPLLATDHSVATMITHAKERPNEDYQIRICDPICPLQLAMACSIRLSSSPTGSPFMSINEKRYTIDASGDHKSRAGSNTAGKNSTSYSREDLESHYQKASSLPTSDNKATILSKLGCAYYTLYEEMKQKVDLEKAIWIHEEAIRFTSVLHPELADHFEHAGDALQARFEQSGDPAFIEKAISHYDTALGATDESNPTRATRLSVLGTALSLRFEHLGHLADIDRAISTYQMAIEIASEGHPDKPSLLSNLGGSLLRRFQRLGSLIDLDRAISVLQEAAELTLDGHPSKPSRLNNLGVSLHYRYERLGSLIDLNNAISVRKEAIKITPDGDPDMPSLLSNLGNSLRFRFERLGNLVDVDSAISFQQEAVKITPDGDPDKPPRLHNLGGSLLRRFERLGNLIDVDSAISVLQEAAKMTPDGHPNKSSILSGLGSSLRSRFERLGTLVDVDTAISAQQEAVKITPNGHPKKPSQLNDLGNSLVRRFERLGSLTDLDSAVSVQREAVKMIPDDHPLKPLLLSNLGNSLRCRFERLDNLIDVDDALSVQQEAVKTTPHGHPDKPSRLINLGGSLRCRFERLGNLIDLDSAISVLQEAAKMTPDGHPNKPSLLNNLGGSLRCRFQRLGNLIDIDSTISVLQEAVKIIPDGHPNKPSLLNDLGISLRCRFQRLGSLIDVDSAISVQQEAVEITPDGHSKKPSILNDLGNSLVRRFERLGSLVDIDSAVSVQQEAVKTTPDGHPDKHLLLNNLGSTLCCRFERLERLVDVESAISVLQEAAKMTPDGHPDKPSLLNNLGATLLCRFQRLGNLRDVDSAILVQQECVKITLDGHPNKASLLKNLGNSLLRRFERLGDCSDLENGLQSHSDAAHSLVGPPMIRFKASREWARMANGNSRSPLPAWKCAIDLLPRIAWLGLKETEQHALLAEIGDVVREAVAAAAEHKKYETAVEWAEQGRSIVWQNLLNLRSPIDDLEAVNPTLARRLKDIGQQLESPVYQGIEIGQMPLMPAKDVAQRYSRLATEWDTIVDEIRRIPNFEEFLGAKSFAKLAPAASEGPVIILNVHEFRSDALALIPGEPSNSEVSVVNIPLEPWVCGLSEFLFASLTSLLASARVLYRSTDEHESIRPHMSGNLPSYEALDKLSEDLINRLSPPDPHAPTRQSVQEQSSADSKLSFHEILGLLWLGVVKPVLNGLTISAEQDDPVHVWWCATGPLSFLPIHAAGIYGTETKGDIVSDYVFSSYTPTLTAILNQSQPIVQADFQILTVAVAQTSVQNAPSIYGTESEVERVQILAKDNGIQCVNLKKENATMKCVLQEMVKSNWIHLACHGQQNIRNSMESGFLLHDRILKLSEIVKLSLPKADFAFLSACQTATGDEKIAEESVHLAAGMLLSGCRGVIATMWSISDNDAPKVAEDVYRRILKDGKPNREGAARALHEAVKRLRDSGANFLSWVPFIHIGR